MFWVVASFAITKAYWVDARWPIPKYTLYPFFNISLKDLFTHFIINMPEACMQTTSLKL